MLVLLLVGHAWFWKPGIWDTRDGTVREILLDYPGDMFLPSWTDDGRIVVAGYTYQSSVWRYKPTNQTAKRCAAALMRAVNYFYGSSKYLQLTQTDTG